MQAWPVFDWEFVGYEEGVWREREAVSELCTKGLMSRQVGSLRGMPGCTHVDKKIFNWEAWLGIFFHLDAIVVFVALGRTSIFVRRNAPKTIETESTHEKNTSGTYLDPSSLLTLTVPGSTLASIMSACTIATACSVA